MAALPEGFDPQAEEPRKEFDPIPAGKHLAVLVESERKDNAKATGSFLALTFEVIEGPYKGRKLFSNLNLDNPNADAVRIAKQELAEISKAVGVMKLHDSRELHDLPLLLEVGMEKRKDNGELKNKIKKYLPKSSAAAATAAPAPTTTKTAPWKR